MSNSPVSESVDVAVVGATGAVGEVMMSILAERKFPVDRLYPLASARSTDRTVEFRGERLPVSDLAAFDFSKTRIAFFSAGASVSQTYAPQAAAAGALVVDNTSQFRYDDDVPLVVPEVNPHALANHNGIIANPNCSTIQLLVALKPLHDEAKITRINVCTYQSVSGAGRRAIDELKSQSAALIADKQPEVEVMDAQIAFNALPHIDQFQDNGYTKEEMKIVWETQKIFEDQKIKINPTAVRVPVFYAHSEAVQIETERKLTVARATDLLSAAPGVRVIDTRRPGGYPTAAIDATGADDVFVGRIREDISCENGLNLWIVADNLRKGAALNSVQIAERLLMGDQSRLRSAVNA